MTDQPEQRRDLWGKESCELIKNLHGWNIRDADHNLLAWTSLEGNADRIIANADEVTRLRQELAETDLELDRTVAGYESALTAERALRTRLVEALGFYADRERYFHDDGECAPICSDEGDIARAALAEARALEVKPASVPGDEQPGSG